MAITDRFPVFENRRHSKKLEEILRKVAACNDHADLDLIRDAYDFAHRVHDGQRRKKGGAYIVHPLDVAWECADHWMDDTSIAAALLHDCIEDAPEEERLTREVIDDQFGPDVGRIVEGLTKLRHGDFRETVDPKLETLKKLLTATVAEDIRTLVIKVFDRTDNIRSVEVHSPESQRRIARETLRFYVPIAARLGLFKEARVMEDHVMRVLQPELYKAITRWLSSNQKKIGRRVDKLTREIHDTLKALGIRSTYRFYHKGIYTIFEALRVEKLPLRRIDEGCNFNLCLVVDDADACFRTLNLVHRRFVHLPARVRDFVNNPKVNGYQSLHTMCTAPEIPKIQVLIRTEQMNVENHIGVITQLRRGKLGDTSWLDELVDSFQNIGSDHLLELTSRVFFAEIDVLTPQGATKKLPQGSTALDFAYQIHTEVGDRARGAVIDGHPRPLRTTLRSGQKVEIVTASGVNPSFQRLGWVTTTRAAIAIRKALQRAEREAIELVVDQFAAFTRDKLGIPIKRGSTIFTDLLGSLDLVDETAFGREIYAGRLDFDHTIPHLVAVTPAPNFKKMLKVLRADGLVDDDEARQIQKMANPETLRLLIGDVVCEHLLSTELPQVPIHIENLRYPIPLRLAGCCRPEFGDEIVAHTARDRGATIHRINCREIRDMVALWPAQMATASWSERPRTETVRYELHGRDRRGLLLALTHMLAEMKVDVRSVKMVAGEAGEAHGWAQLELDDLTDRDELAVRMESVPGIKSARVVYDG